MAYGRKYAVEFDTPFGPHRLTDVDVKFRVEYSQSATLTQAEISICNLTRANIEYLTTYVSVWIAKANASRIRLFAGYEDEEPINLIFDGDILSAIPTEPPEVWLNCTAISGGYGSIQMFSESILVPVPMRTVFEQAAGWVGMDLEWNATVSKTIKSFDCTGNRNKLIEQLNSLGEISVFEENGKMVVVDEAHPKRSGNIFEISEETGMVSVPKIDQIGIEAKIFLNTKIKCGDTVHITSKRVPIASGNYYVMNVIHEGHFRGDLWYTTIKTRRLDAYGKKLVT